ncbi:MAG TPA: hypothetical protein VFU35_08275, partial [Jatrophihabitans sp.]|nr:hypothetical protein [Jatrophihabitans sp.]
DDLIVLFCWLIGALVIHDGLLSPLLVGIGVALRRYVPDRGRRYLQAALVTGGLLTVVALPMIYRQGSQPAAKAILRQDYGANLATLLAIVTGLVVLLYLASVLRGRQAASAANGRPALDHTESSR